VLLRGQSVRACNDTHLHIAVYAVSSEDVSPALCCCDTFSTSSHTGGSSAASLPSEGISLKQPQLRQLQRGSLLPPALLPLGACSQILGWYFYGCCRPGINIPCYLVTAY